jgi:hypothetical protein
MIDNNNNILNLDYLWVFERDKWEGRIIIYFQCIELLRSNAKKIFERRRNWDSRVCIMKWDRQERK